MEGSNTKCFFVLLNKDVDKQAFRSHPHEN